MKKIITVLVALIITSGLFAQAPPKMTYQSIIRDGSGSLIRNTAIGIRITVLQDSATGTPVYREIFSPNPQTNANGLATVEVGGGTPTIGTFAGIDWSAGPYYIETEADPTGGTTYTISGTSQLLSVPYALYAKNSSSSGTRIVAGTNVSGTGYTAGGANGTYTVTFTTAYTSIPVVTATLNGLVSGYGTSLIVTNVSTTGFNVSTGYIDANSGYVQPSNAPFSFIAAGN